MSTQYEMLEEKKDESHYEETDENDMNNKNKIGLWLSSTFYLQSIDIDKCEFKVKGWIYLFWNDPNLSQQFKNNHNDLDNEIKCCHLSTKLRNNLPLNINDYELFENSKTMKFITDPLIEYNSNGTFLMTLAMECTFYQKFEIKNYPKDEHMLNIQLLYNNNNYEWIQDKEIPNWIKNKYDKKKIDLYNWNHRISFPMIMFNSNEWQSLSPILIHKKNFKIYLISFRIQRIGSNIIYTFILPLIILISCTFCIFAYEISQWSLRLNLLFLSFIFTAIIHMMIVIKIGLRLKTFIFMAYLILTVMMVESILLGLNVFEIDNPSDIDIVIGYILGFMWLACTVYASRIIVSCRSESAKKTYWRMRYRQQWEEWKKSKFCHGSYVYHWDYMIKDVRN